MKTIHKIACCLAVCLMAPAAFSDQCPASASNISSPWSYKNDANGDAAKAASSMAYKYTILTPSNVILCYYQSSGKTIVIQKQLDHLPQLGRSNKYKGDPDVEDDPGFIWTDSFDNKLCTANCTWK